MYDEILYFGFDLDDTIGYIHQFFPIIAIFLPTIYDIDVSKEFLDKLKKAYEKFMLLLVKSEKENPHILNPVVLETLKIASSRESYCMIYSNNSVLPLLYFASDLIENIFEKDIFCAHVHLDHDIRNESDDFSRSKTKTWGTYQKIFTELCRVPEHTSKPTPENSVFFDDLIHDDLQVTLGKNYHHIVPYHQRFDEGKEIYQTSIQELLSDEEFRTYISTLISKIEEPKIKKKVIELQNFSGGSKQKTKKRRKRNYRKYYTNKIRK